MGVTDTASAQLCVRTKSVLALAEPPHTVSAAALPSVHASLSRANTLWRMSCSQCLGRHTPVGTLPSGLWRPN
eukprot:9171417-Pyramimonas_sp.AAC.1